MFKLAIFVLLAHARAGANAIHDGAQELLTVAQALEDDASILHTRKSHSSQTGLEEEGGSHIEFPKFPVMPNIELGTLLQSVNSPQPDSNAQKLISILAVYAKFADIAYEYETEFYDLKEIKDPISQQLRLREEVDEIEFMRKGNEKKKLMQAKMDADENFRRLQQRAGLRAMNDAFSHRLDVDFGIYDVFLEDDLLAFTGFFVDPHTQKKVMIVSFRGTDNKENWLRNLAPLPSVDGVAGGFHRGYLVLKEKIIQSIKKYMTVAFPIPHLKKLEHKHMPTENNPPTKLAITGHSLGGALASVCGYDLWNTLPELQGIMEVITFSQPRAFRSETAKKVTQTVPILRVINEGDWVPRLPPVTLFVRFEHVGRALFFDWSDISGSWEKSVELVHRSASFSGAYNETNPGDQLCAHSVNRMFAGIARIRKIWRTDGYFPMKPGVEEAGPAFCEYSFIPCFVWNLFHDMMGLFSSEKSCPYDPEETHEDNSNVCDNRA